MCARYVPDGLGFVVNLPLSRKVHGAATSVSNAGGNISFHECETKANIVANIAA